MTELLKALESLLNVNPRIGFSLAAAGVSLALLKVWGALPDAADIVVFPLGYITLYGFYVWITSLPRYVGELIVAAARRIGLLDRS